MYIEDSRRRDVVPSTLTTKLRGCLQEVHTVALKIRPLISSFETAVGNGILWQIKNGKQILNELNEMLNRCIKIKILSWNDRRSKKQMKIINLKI